MTAAVILVEASPRVAATGAVQTVRLAGGGAKVPYHYGDEHWQAGVVALPKVITSLEYPGDDLGQGGIPQALSLGWSPATRAALDAVATLVWSDAAISIRLGAEGGALPPVLVSGTVLDASVEPGALQIAMSDPAADLKHPLLVDRFAGTGGAEGPASWDGRIRRRAWGRCFNVAGDMIDPPNNILCFGDPNRPWQGFDAVRDKGVAALPAQLTLLAWQGSVAATFAALQAAAAPSGGGVLCPSIACIKWWTQPAGDLCADIRGETEGGYVETAAAIVQRLVAARSTLGFAAGTIAAAVAARPAVYGWLADNATDTVASIIDTILGDVSLLWALANSEISIRRWEWGASQATGHSQEVRRLKTYKPVGTRRIGYRRNWKQMARGDLADSLFATDFVFPDGQLLSDLQPAEPGADKTADHVAADVREVAGRDAAQLIEQADINTADIIAQALRQDDAQLVFDARTLVEGQPVGPTFLTFRNEQNDTNAVLNSSLQLLGGKTADGTAWVLDAETVKLSPTLTLAQRLAEIGVTTDAFSGTAALLLEVLFGPGGGESRAVIRVDANDNMASIVTSAGEEISRIGLIAGRTTIAKPDGTLLATFGVVGDLVYIPNLLVDTIKVGSRGTTNGGQVVTSSSVISGTGTSNFITIISDYVTLDDAGRISATATFAQSFPSGDDTWNVRLRIDGVEVFPAGGQKTQDVVTVSGALDRPAGTYAVDVRWAAPSGVSNHAKTLETVGFY